MKEQIKELRVKIDGVSQLVKTLKTKKTQVDIALKTKQETIDDFLNRVESEKLGVEIIEQSEQIKKCYDSLILAKAWLGKVLGEIGEPTPYANDGSRKTVDDIEPTADKPVNVGNNIGESTWYNGNFNATESKGDLIIEGKHWSDFNHIEKVDWLRQEIEKIIEIVKNIYVSNYQVSREFNISRTNSYNHLCEARFWLGFELERIRESSGGNI